MISRLFYFFMLLSLYGYAEKPNFIIIFTDDQGYNDLGCFGSKEIKTPHIDQMAAEGAKLTSFYVASPVCSPSRAALLTGCYPKRVDMEQHVLFPHSKKGLNPEEVTIADYLKGVGYKTAAVGKWHLGHHKEFLPTRQGFDSYFGIPYSNDMSHPDNKGKPKGWSTSWADPEMKEYIWRTPLMLNEEIYELPCDQRTITRRYTDRAINFIKSNKENPFFLYLPHSMPHLPLYVPDEVYDPDEKQAYRLVIEHIDQQVGRLIQTLKDEGLSKNTIVIYTSDNGPWTRFGHFGGKADPLRDGKGTTFEGGQRVPCVMWAPGYIKAGQVKNEMMSTIDILPTIASIIGEPLQTAGPIDGVDQKAFLLNDAPSARNEFMFYSSRGDIEGIRQGDYKYFVAKGKKKQAQLYNLKLDIAESQNLMDQHPEKAKELETILHSRDKEISGGKRMAGYLGEVGVK